MTEVLPENSFLNPHCYPLLQEMRNIVKNSHFQENVKSNSDIYKVSFSNLKKLLSQSPVQVMEIVSPQIMEPLVIIFSQGKRCESDTIDLLESLQTILERSQIEDYNLHYRIIIECCKLFSQKKENAETCDLISEELSASVLKLLTLIFVKFSNIVHFSELVLTYQNLPLVAMIIQNTLTYLTLKDKLHPQKLQILALKLLDSLFRLESREEKQYRVLAQIIGSLFPGIASSLFKIILNSHSFKTGTVTKTLQVLPVFLSLVLDAAVDENSKNGDNQSLAKLYEGEMPDAISRLLPESQDEKWLEKVMSNIQKFLESSENILTTSSSIKIRLQGVIFAEEVLSNCGAQLNVGCLHSLIITVTRLENDESEEIRSLATNVRNKIFDSRPVWFSGDDFQLRFCDNVLELSAKIPQCSHLQNDDSFAALLSKILACLNVIDSKQNKFFRIENVLEKIFDNLASCFEVEIAQIQLITSVRENFNRCSDEELAMASVAFNADDVGIKFKYVSRKHLALIKKILRVVLTGTSVSAVFEVLSKKMSQSYETNSDCYTTLFTLVVECSEVELSSDVDFLNALCTEKLKKAVSCCDSFSKTTILYQLLCLQLVQSACRVLKQRTDIKLIIFNVTALVSHDINSVAHAATQTLLRIAQLCGDCESVSQLLEQNSDYVFSDGVLKLKHCLVYPEVVNVLCIMLQYTGPKCLLFVKHLTVECSEQLKLAGRQRSKLMERLFLLCSEISRYLHRNYYTDQLPKYNSDFGEATIFEEIDSKESWVNLGQRLACYLQTKIARDTVGRDEAPKNEVNENSETEVEADDSILQDNPVHVQIAHKLIRISIYYLYSDNFKSKIYCLTAAENCFLVLSQAIAGNFLLPMIHHIWNAVCARLKDDKPAVVLRACKLILLFSEISTDFVRRRVVQDCVPTLLRWVEKLIGKFLGKTNLSSYDKYTYDYKLLCLLVQKVPQLFVNCKIVPWDREITFNLCKAIVRVSKVGTVPEELSSIACESKLFLKKHESAIIELLELS